MTPKQLRFVEEYLVDLNATQAAIRAGYSEKTAYSIGEENLKKPEIASAVEAAMQERSKRTEITADRVLQELAKIGFADIRKLFTEEGGLRRIESLDDDAAATLSSVEVITRRVPGSDRDDPEYENVAKIKLWDKRAALVDLGRHLKLFTDKVEASGPDGSPLEVRFTRRDADAG
jgi:phage terminase small subunit